MEIFLKMILQSHHNHDSEYQLAIVDHDGIQRSFYSVSEMKNEKKNIWFYKIRQVNVYLIWGKGTSRSNTDRAEITDTPKEFSGTSCIRYGF